VLAKNFPRSPYLNTKYAGRQAPWWKLWAGD
jgi:hypothetical protein